MPAGEIHVYDIGTVFQYTIYDQDSNVVNISGGTYTLVFQKPNNTQLVVAPTALTNGSDGILQYTSVSGDINVAGMWRGQIRINQGSSQWRTDIPTFKVYQNL